MIEGELIMNDELNKKACWAPKEIQSRIDYVQKHGDIDFSKEKYEKLSHIKLGEITTEAGNIDIIDTEIKQIDKRKNIGILFGWKRDNYMIKPGIYAIGNPKPSSPVIVSCNYKYTFDSVRKELKGVDCWLLILNTFGVNVWCAAGKGTFGTQELIRRISAVKLDKITNHKALILPQLGATGVNSHEVRKATGYRIIFGPVEAKDLKDFINNRFKATEEMRRVSFNFQDRLKLTPLEFIQSMKYYFVALIILVITNLITLRSFDLAFTRSIYQSIPFMIGIAIAAIAFPLLLPVLPFRSFSLNGVLLGILFAIPIMLFKDVFFISENLLWIISYMSLLITMMANITLSFTGSTTYTSFSGVLKETLWTIPISIVVVVLSIITMCIV